MSHNNLDDNDSVQTFPWAAQVLYFVLKVLCDTDASHRGLEAWKFGLHNPPLPLEAVGQGRELDAFLNWNMDLMQILRA